MADEKSARTKMIEESKVSEDLGGLKSIVKEGTVAASNLLDKLGFKQEKEYEGKAKEELKVKKRAGGTIKSSASKRADGCAQRGKTKGRMV